MSNENPPAFDRRSFGKTLSVATAGSLLSSTPLAAAVPNALPLKIAGYPYERVTALASGQVSVEGCDVTFETGKIGELNTHAFSGPATRDVTEVGLIPYLLAFANDDFRKYRLLPILVLKVFRHKSIFVHADRGIERPEDLRGRKVATVGYSSSGLTWIRGILQDEYGVSPDEIQWVVTSKDSAKGQTGGASKWETLRPDGLSIVDAVARAHGGHSEVENVAGAGARCPPVVPPTSGSTIGPSEEM